MASGAKRAADANDVDIREYEVIYKLLEDIQLAMEGLLEPDLVEESLAKQKFEQLLQLAKELSQDIIYNLASFNEIALWRVVRADKVIFEGDLDSLKRSKDDVKEVNTGFECGVGCDKFSSWIEGDIIEAFKLLLKENINSIINI